MGLASKICKPLLKMWLCQLDKCNMVYQKLEHNSILFLRIFLTLTILSHSLSLNDCHVLRLLPPPRLFPRWWFLPLAVGACGAFGAHSAAGVVADAAAAGFEWKRFSYS